MRGGKHRYGRFDHSIKLTFGKERAQCVNAICLYFRKKCVPVFYLCNPSSKSGVKVASILPLNLTTTELRVAVSFCDVMNSFSSP